MSKRSAKTGGRGGVGRVGLLLLVVFLALGASCAYLYFEYGRRAEVLKAERWLVPEQKLPVEGLRHGVIQDAVSRLEHPAQSTHRKEYVLSSEPRVVAVGSAYPIPFDAAVCPFSGIEQPRMDQLDRDGDGLPDVWEEKYGLDKYDPKDAQYDLDKEGFTNLEEFRAGTDPGDPASRPATAAKLRFVESKVRMFRLRFQAVTELSDGRRVFQLNVLSQDNSYFKELGEALEGAVLTAYYPPEDPEGERLVLKREEQEIVLPKGVVVREPESRAELINLLDRELKTVTIGQLLSIYDDVYTVVGIGTSNATVRLEKTGELFEVVALTDEERKKLFGGFE